MLGLILACAFAADTPTIIAKTLKPPIRTCFIRVPPFGSTGEGNDRVRPMFQLCRRRTQFKTNNLRRATMRRGVSFANENPARVWAFKGGCPRAGSREPSQGCWEDFHQTNTLGAVNVPHGASGTNSPYGMRSWKCRITAAPVLGIEIASASPAAVLNSTT